MTTIYPASGRTNFETLEREYAAPWEYININDVIFTDAQRLAGGSGEKNIQFVSKDVYKEWPHADLTFKLYSRGFTLGQNYGKDGFYSSLIMAWGLHTNLMTAKSQAIDALPLVEILAIPLLWTQDRRNWLLDLTKTRNEKPLDLDNAKLTDVEREFLKTRNLEPFAFPDIIRARSKVDPYIPDVSELAMCLAFKKSFSMISSRDHYDNDDKRSIVLDEIESMNVLKGGTPDGTIYRAANGDLYPLIPISSYKEEKEPIIEF